MKFYRILFFVFFVISFFSCDDDIIDSKSKVSCVLTLNDNTVKHGDFIHFEITPKGKSAEGLGVDSIIYYIDKKEVDYSPEFEIDSYSLGKHRIDAKIIFSNGASCDKYVFFTVLSSVVPRYSTFKVVNTYNHDDMSYTQGLEYADGYIYEGTGQYEHSVLRYYSLFDQKPLKEIALDPDYFGEGITIIGDKIFQITYKEQKAFVYDKSSFEQIGEFVYDDEGWGLTHDDEYIIMSNGSNEIVFRDPVDFSIKKHIRVYDDRSKVEEINELEYVNGLLYANIYQTNNIVIIDPSTGEVLEYIDCTGILDPKDVKSKIDVLNGIAYNPNTKTFYITGKFWPKMFEVTFD